MSEKRVAPPDGGSGDLVLIQRHLENLSAGEILEELDARMEEMTDQSCDPELIRLYLDVLEEKEPLGLELDPEASLQRFLEERAGEESTPPEEPAARSTRRALKLPTWRVPCRTRCWPRCARAYARNTASRATRRRSSEFRPFFRANRYAIRKTLPAIRPQA